MEKFFKFTGSAMIDTFGIKKKSVCEMLNYWLSADGQLSDFENKTIDNALQRFNNLGMSWNEEELKMHFISAIFSITDINVDGVCRVYFERPLEGVVQNKLMHVKTDCMIAQPKLSGDPDKPFFFLQEFKQKQLWGRTDPQGQMLAAMLLAQEFNADDHYLYGCYVIEKNWHFTTLRQLDYCVSRQFDSTRKDDLLQIVFILRKLRELIEQRSTLNK